MYKMRMIKFNALAVIACIVLPCCIGDIFHVDSSSKRSDFMLDLSNPEAGYHGLIRENETNVAVTPNIRAIGGSLCNFKITNKHHGEVPFDIILDEVSNTAGILSKKPLNCEKRKTYKFDIQGVSCNGEESQRVTVHITVLDVNEYEPTFVQPSHVVEVDEGQIYDEIVRVEALDQDCSPKFGDVCKYEILNSDQPFEISDDGSIKNIEPLNYEMSHNHILSVVAYDCGMKRSQPVMVNIKVNQICHLGWKGIPEIITYSPGSGEMEMFHKAKLDLCRVPCTVDFLQVSVSLTTDHIGKGCDRDTYSVESQRKLCGASMESVDLLPPSTSLHSWTKSIAQDDGHESDQIFSFDGKTGVIVPESVMAHNLGNTFTISVWLKHQPNLAYDKRHKEHILCNADDHKMNRHHFALFVRNCRLILLLRKEFNEGNLNSFRPAEWRWKLPQVCDNKWHHYAINMEFPKPDLYVDGRLVHDENNPETIDDWPLHPGQDINTTLSVGACWQGTDRSMKHALKGSLAGLSVLIGKIERPQVLECLHKCKESLQNPPTQILQPGMELQANNELTMVTVKGNNETNLETLLQKVSYINSRDYPTPGKRALKITSNVRCANGKSLKIPTIESFIEVIKTIQPQLIVNGTSNVAHEYEDFRMGVRIFGDVRIMLITDKEEKELWKNGEPLSVIVHKIDSCHMTIYPTLNPDHETVTLPEKLLASLSITAKVNRDGVFLTGVDRIYNYEQALRQIHYRNERPAYYLNRVFKLVCSDMNGRFVSNEYLQTLTVIHPQRAVSEPAKISTAMPKMEIYQQHNPEGHVAHAQVNKHHVEFKPASSVNDVYLASGLGDSQSLIVGGASHAVTIIIVVCVGFLLFMIVLGVIRIRAAHRRSQQEDLADQEMAWDDSALTITVNPMEFQNVENTTINRVLHEDSEEERDGDSSDNGSLYEDSSDEDERDHKSKDLEWDNSTLNM